MTAGQLHDAREPSRLVCILLTSCAGRMLQVLDVTVLDSHLTGRPEVGHVRLPLSRIPRDGSMTAWMPLQVSCTCQPLRLLCSVLPVDRRHNP